MTLSISEGNERTMTFTVAMKPSEIRKVKELAHLRSMSVSKLIRDLVAEENTKAA